MFWIIGTILLVSGVSAICILNGIDSRAEHLEKEIREYGQNASAQLRAIFRILEEQNKTDETPH